MEVVIGIVFSVVFFLFFMQNKAGRSDETPSAMEAPPVQTRVDGRQEASPLEAAPAEGLSPLPQESVLRRHYVAHVRQMIEDLSVAQPVESVLRRHYQQLIDSQLEECLGSEANLQALTARYEAYKRAV